MNEVPSTHTDKSNFAPAYTWAQYRIWAATAREFKEKLTVWQVRVLTLTLVGAALGMLSEQTSVWLNETLWPNFFGWLSAIALGLAAFFTKEILSPERERFWVRARSIAEAFKSQVYLYFAKAPPYEKGDPAALLKKTNELCDVVADLTPKIISDEQKRKRFPSGPLSVEKYTEIRVNDQIKNYYYPKAQEHEAIVKKCRTAGLVLGALAVILGILGGFGFKYFSGWVAVISTATAAIGSYLYTGRRQYLVVSYQSTARQLERLLTEWKISGKNDKDIIERNRFITNCEATISVENSAWMAEKK